MCSGMVLECFGIRHGQTAIWERMKGDGISPGYRKLLNASPMRGKQCLSSQPTASLNVDKSTSAALLSGLGSNFHTILVTFIKADHRKSPVSCLMKPSQPQGVNFWRVQTKVWYEQFNACLPAVNPMDLCEFHQPLRSWNSHELV